MAVILKITKGEDLNRDIYYPNYDPEEDEGDKIVLKSECKTT